MPDEPGKIIITEDDLKGDSSPPPSGGNWGKVTDSAGGSGYPPAQPPPGGGTGNFFRKSWFYLALAGLGGSVLAWAITEPTYHDGPSTINASNSDAPEAITGGVLDEFARRLDRENAQTGEINFSLMWNNFNDLDLHGIDPSGEQISFKNKRGTNGHLDVDENVSPKTAEPVENIYYENPPEGIYKVSVKHYSDHDEYPKTLPFTVRVKVGTQTTDYTGNVSEKETVDIHSFNYDSATEETRPSIVQPGFGNWAMFPLVIVLACVGYGVSESLSGGSWRKALKCGFIALVLGVILGLAAFKLSNFFFQAGTAFLADGVGIIENTPMRWLLRGLCWTILGTACGVTYGICGQSRKKCIYGAIGGAIGAFFGGVLFDPVSLAI
ncbi:MAG: hypothetical protein HN675_04975, partial [Opitutae bacterium]|nr:hypothetical protein [Opitutae bacterium]